MPQQYGHEGKIPSGVYIEQPLTKTIQYEIKVLQTILTLILILLV
jgi:hypothetical protein